MLAQASSCCRTARDPLAASSHTRCKLPPSSCNSPVSFPLNPSVSACSYCGFGCPLIHWPNASKRHPHPPADHLRWGGQVRLPWYVRTAPIEITPDRSPPPIPQPESPETWHRGLSSGRGVSFGVSPQKSVKPQLIRDSRVICLLGIPFYHLRNKFGSVVRRPSKPENGV